jgi:flagellar basal-body rod protein FlgB
MANVSDALTGRMNFLIERQGVVASNIANANTPKYLAKDIVKSDSAASGGFAMAVTNAQHMAIASSNGPATGKLTEDTRFIQHNGNSVRLDDEMIKMNDIQLNYRMMTELYAKQVGMQKMALGQR